MPAFDVLSRPPITALVRLLRRHGPLTESQISVEAQIPDLAAVLDDLIALGVVGIAPTGYFLLPGTTARAVDEFLDEITDASPQVAVRA